MSREANGKQQLMIEVYSVESYDSFKVSGRKGKSFSVIILLHSINMNVIHVQ